MRRIRWYRVSNHQPLQATAAAPREGQRGKRGKRGADAAEVNTPRPQPPALGRRRRLRLHLRACRRGRERPTCPPPTPSVSAMWGGGHSIGFLSVVRRVGLGRFQLRLGLGWGPKQRREGDAGRGTFFDLPLLLDRLLLLVLLAPRHIGVTSRGRPAWHKN